MLNKLSWGWVGFGGWPKQVIIKLTSASTAVGVEVGSELGKRQLTLSTSNASNVSGEKT